MTSAHHITVNRAAPGMLRSFRVTVLDGRATTIAELDTLGYALIWTNDSRAKVPPTDFLRGVAEQAVDLAEAIDMMAPSTQQRAPATNPADPLGDHHGRNA